MIFITNNVIKKISHNSTKTDERITIKTNKGYNKKMVIKFNKINLISKTRQFIH